MSAKDGNGSKSKPSRRNVLLASTTLAAASALGTAASVDEAAAQAQQRGTGGMDVNAKPPYNIIFVIRTHLKIA